MLCIGSALLSNCQNASLLTTPTYYSAAAINDGQLTVFPWAGGPPVTPGVSVAGLGITRYSRDGRSLYTSYTSVEGDRSEIHKIDIRTGHSTKWLEIPGFTAVVGFAIPPDESRVFVSGRYVRTAEQICGIFEIQTARANAPRVLVRQSGQICDIRTLWRNISLSPDSQLAVAWQPRSTIVEIINLENGTLKSIGYGGAVSWSPDGKWIAVVDGYSSKRYHVLLLDASDPSKTKDLGTTDGFTLAWSPDSRYVLLWDVEVRCLPSGFGYWGSLEVADIETGRRAVIKSSRCQVNNSTGGWVNNDAWK